MKCTYMKTIVNLLLPMIVIIMLVVGCGQSTTNNSGSDTGNIPTQTIAEDYCKKLQGSIFQYKYEDSDPDNLTFTILFNCKSDSLKGLMFGPVAAGEEGLYFFKENLDSVRVDNGFMLFSLVQSNIYQKPFTLGNYDKKFPNEVLGGSNFRQFFKGKVEGDSIIFTCNSLTGAECYADTMVFKKKDHLK